MKTLASDGPTREITSSTGRMAADCAISCGKRSARSARFSASRRCPRRSARPEFDLRLENGGQPRVVPRLLDEIARAAAHRFHRQFHAAPRRHHDHGQRGVQQLYAVEQFQPFLPAGGVARVIEVHQDRVEVARFHFVDHGGGRVHGHGLVAFAFDEEAERFEDIRLVVGHQDAGRAGFGRFHRSLSRCRNRTASGTCRANMLCHCSVSGYYYTSTAGVSDNGTHAPFGTGLTFAAYSL